MGSSLLIRFARRLRTTFFAERNESPAVKVREMGMLWDRLAATSELGFISHTKDGAVWDEREFHLVGQRFVDRMVDRFLVFGSGPLAEATVLEIGCGVGRFLVPLAHRVRYVIGADISSRMLAVARRRCADQNNVSLFQNDGESLAALTDSSTDYCVSAGVFQHLTHFEVIRAYILEALRVLKPSGVFVFQFDGTRTRKVGYGQEGARITAKGLDKALSDASFRICEISQDPDGLAGNLVVVIKRPHANEVVPARARRFRGFPLTERTWLTGVYDDIRTPTFMHERLKGNVRERLTFFD